MCPSMVYKSEQVILLNLGSLFTGTFLFGFDGHVTTQPKGVSLFISSQTLESSSWEPESSSSKSSGKSFMSIGVSSKSGNVSSCLHGRGKHAVSWSLKASVWSVVPFWNNRKTQLVNLCLTEGQFKCRNVLMPNLILSIWLNQSNWGLRLIHTSTLRYHTSKQCACLASINTSIQWERNKK